MPTHPLMTGAAAVTATGAAVLAYSLWEAQAYVVRQESIALLPPGSQDLRVLHLSDVHLMPNDTKRAAWLRSLVELDPDLVVSTGDHISHRDAVPVLLDALDPLLDLPGVFVFGSNDYFAPVLKNPLMYLRNGPAPRKHAGWLPWQDLRDGLSASGWLDLNNHREQLKVGGLMIDVVGVDDPHIQRDRYADVGGPASPGADLALGVVHAPYRRVLDAMTRDERSLILAGHTHGGQVCLPGYGTLVTNCDLDRRRAKGLSRYEAPNLDLDDALMAPSASWLHVSAGIGTSPYAPIRLACRPEAVLLTLTAR
jgi:predicted MPP superfamily phosphohydrolase